MWASIAKMKVTGPHKKQLKNNWNNNLGLRNFSQSPKLKSLSADLFLPIKGIQNFSLLPGRQSFSSSLFIYLSYHAFFILKRIKRTLSKPEQKPRKIYAEKLQGFVKAQFLRLPAFNFFSLFSHCVYVLKVYTLIDKSKKIFSRSDIPNSLMSLE